MTARIIDMHCHHVALSPQNGGYMHPKFMEGIRPKLFATALGILSPRDLIRKLPSPEELDRLYREKLIGELEASRIDHAAILAFDGVYDVFGEFSYPRTPQYVSNDAVIELCKSSSKMLFCASINPYRPDWKEELQKCHEAGAVLMKWLPSVMGFDPADTHVQPFYRELREIKMPLLIHIGYEYALPVIDDAFCGLDRLEIALKSGVTVIAAHCCGGRPLYDSASEFEQMIRLVYKYPNLYLDVSGMASVHRKHRLINSLRHAELQDRLVFGTDFPVPLQVPAFYRELKRSGIKSRQMTKNYFDRYLTLMQAAGLPECALSRGYDIIAPRLSIAPYKKQLVEV